MPQGWMSGSCGKPGEGGKSVVRDEIASRVFPFSFPLFTVWGYSCPRVLRTAHAEGGGSLLL